MTAQQVPQPATGRRGNLVAVPGVPTEATEYLAAAVVLVTGEDARITVIDLLAHPAGQRLLHDITSAREPVTSGFARALSAADLIRSLPGPGRPAPLITESGAALSARERDVLELVTDGLTNQEIAARLYLSMNTVKSYIRTGYRKIGVERRPQAVSWGLRHGLGRLEP